MIWTFEALARANSRTLEEILRQSAAPDVAQLIGRAYNGFNHESIPLGRANAIKFRKAFFLRDGAPFGVNQMVAQDGSDSEGDWPVINKDGRPVELGYYSVGAVPENFGKRYDVYRHLLGLNYNVDPNPKLHLLMRAIYDVIGLPNPDDSSLILGKAFLRIVPGVPIVASYFVLGSPQPYAGSTG